MPLNFFEKMHNLFKLGAEARKGFTVSGTAATYLKGQTNMFEVVA